MEVKDYLIGALALVVVVLGCFILSGLNYASNVVKPEANVLQVFYLYPRRCVNCDLRVAGQCDFCSSYYDERVLGTVGADLGVDMKFVVSDAVDKPNVLAVKDGRAGLIDAKSKYSIAGGLCGFAGVDKSCIAFKEEVNKTRICVKKYGLSEDTIVYHYGKSECIYCDKTTPFVDSLANEVSYNETYRYSVKKADDGNSDDRKMLDECFSSFINLDYIPQVICPKTGDIITGGVDKLSTLRNFADKCIEGR